MHGVSQEARQGMSCVSSREMSLGNLEPTLTAISLSSAMGRSPAEDAKVRALIVYTRSPYDSPKRTCEARSNSCEGRSDKATRSYLRSSSLSSGKRSSHGYVTGKLLRVYRNGWEALYHLVAVAAVVA